MPVKVTPEMAPISNQLASALLKDGEGVEVAGTTFFKTTGQRLWEPNPDSFGFKVHRGNTYAKMDSTNPQVVAYYINGTLHVTHNGFERHQVYELFKGDWVFQTVGRVS